MDKLISLQRAIDAVHKNYDTILDFTSDGKTISSSIEDILSELPSAEPESISRWKNEFKEYVDSLDIARDDWKGIIEYIDEVPSAEQDTTTHDSIPAETGENDEDRTSGDCISRQRAIDALKSRKTAEQSSAGIMRNAVVDFCIGIVKKLPSAQPVAKKIGYAECANAMLKMWIDNVLTDGEYNRIMDKLNAHYDAERRQK